MKLVGTKFYFIGIGGIGMCGLAELIHNLGAIVSGSDLRVNEQVDHLKDLGIKIHQGHDAKNLGDIDVVVYSSAVSATNVEYSAARERKIPVIPRAEALAEIMRLKRGVAIAGTHGKTTTTSLTASAFLSANSDPTIAVGGRLDLIKSTAKLGQGEWFVAEADESDGSFLKLSPEIVVITNIDNDHMDHYSSFRELQNTFYSFALKIPFYGTAIVCGDDPQTRKLFEDFPKKIVFYGTDEANDFVLKGELGNYSIFEKQNGKLELVTSFKLPMPGLHNALNALASFIVSRVAKLDSSLSISGMEKFQGVDRRFQFKGEYKKTPIYDDYAHHPTEVKAVLEAFREKYPHRNIIAAFQPHRYSRFKNCWEDFLTCFDLVDQLYVLPVYKAGEEVIQGYESEDFVKQIGISQVEYCKDFSAVQQKIKSTSEQQLEKQSVFVTLGAGDIWKLGESLCQK